MLHIQSLLQRQQEEKRLVLIYPAFLGRIEMDSLNSAELFWRVLLEGQQQSSERVGYQWIKYPDKLNHTSQNSHYDCSTCYLPLSLQVGWHERGKKNAMNVCYYESSQCFKLFFSNEKSTVCSHQK